MASLNGGVGSEGGATVLGECRDHVVRSGGSGAVAEDETVSVLPRVPESKGMLTMEDGRGARSVSEGASLSECTPAGQERRARFKLGSWGGMMCRRATA